MISSEVKDFPEEIRPFADILKGRSMLVKKQRFFLLSVLFVDIFLVLLGKLSKRYNGLWH